MDKTKLTKLVEETLDSMNAAQRATPAPYLLTRINAKMNRQQPSSVWERIALFLGSPGIAAATVAFVILLNIFIYNYSNTGSDINVQAGTDDYSMNNSSALFDLENLEP